MMLKSMSSETYVTAQANSYNPIREQADRQRQTRHTVQDGSYGFDEQGDVQAPELYSDQMMVDAPTQKTRRRHHR